jgi:hypothetical protein
MARNSETDANDTRSRLEYVSTRLQPGRPLENLDFAMETADHVAAIPETACPPEAFVRDGHKWVATATYDYVPGEQAESR